MTKKQLFMELRKMNMHTDWKNEESVKAYNRRARELRKQLEDEEEKEDEEWLDG